MHRHKIRPTPTPTLLQPPLHPRHTPPTPRNRRRPNPHPQLPQRLNLRLPSPRRKPDVDITPADTEARVRLVEAQDEADIRAGVELGYDGVVEGRAGVGGAGAPEHGDELEGRGGGVCGGGAGGVVVVPCWITRA